MTPDHECRELLQRYKFKIVDDRRSFRRYKTPEGRTNHRFGLLQVIKFVEVKNHHALFEAKCDCGALVTVRGTDLVSMTKRKCGSDCAYKPPKFRAIFATIHDGTVDTRFSK